MKYSSFTFGENEILDESKVDTRPFCLLVITIICYIFTIGFRLGFFGSFFSCCRLGFFLG